MWGVTRSCIKQWHAVASQRGPWGSVQLFGPNRFRICIRPLVQISVVLVVVLWTMQRGGSNAPALLYWIHECASFANWCTRTAPAQVQHSSWVSPAACLNTINCLKTHKYGHQMMKKVRAGYAHVESISELKRNIARKVWHGDHVYWLSRTKVLFNTTGVMETVKDTFLYPIVQNKAGVMLAMCSEQLCLDWFALGINATYQGAFRKSCELPCLLSLHRDKPGINVDCVSLSRSSRRSYWLVRSDVN